MTPRKHPGDSLLERQLLHLSVFGTVILNLKRTQFGRPPTRPATGAVSTMTARWPMSRPVPAPGHRPVAFSERSHPVPSPRAHHHVRTPYTPTHRAATPARTRNTHRAPVTVAVLGLALAGALVTGLTTLPTLPGSPAAAAGPRHSDFDPTLPTPTIEDYGTYQGQVSCDPNAKPGVNDLRNFDAVPVRGTRPRHRPSLRHRWPLRTQGRPRLGLGPERHHKADAQTAETAIEWLLDTVDGEPAARARRLGIMYIIWDRQMWRAYDPDAGWRKYTGSSAHTDHVHFSFTWNGATGANSYWTGAVQPTDYGPCPKWAGVMAAPWQAANPAPCERPADRPAANRRGIYKATTGDSVKQVSRWFAQRPRSIRAWNGYPRIGKVTLLDGQKVRVRAAGARR